MAIPVVVRAATLLAQTLSDPKKTTNLLIILLIPLGFIVLVFGFFTYDSNNPKDIFNIAVEEVIIEENTINNINSSLVKNIYSATGGKIELSLVKQFIRGYLVREITETITVDDEEKTITYNAFISIIEIMDMLKNEPFNLDDSIIFMISLYNISSLDSNNTIKPELMGQLVMPAKGRITSYFGMRNNPITGEPLSMHTGIDIAGEHHQDIISAFDGVIDYINTSISSYGNYIRIKHQSKEVIFYTVYAHLSKINVVVGQDVKQGEVIGIEGGAKTDNNPGQSTGHHLHFEVRTDRSIENAIDPNPYLRR